MLLFFGSLRTKPNTAKAAIDEEGDEVDKASSRKLPEYVRLWPAENLQTHQILGTDDGWAYAPHCAEVDTEYRQAYTGKFKWTDGTEYLQYGVVFAFIGLKNHGVLCRRVFSSQTASLENANPRVFIGCLVWAFI